MVSSFLHSRLCFSFALIIAYFHCHITFPCHNCTTVYASIFTIDGHLGSFQFGAIKNNADHYLQ